MNPDRIITINALLLIAIGLAFVLYGPIMLAMYAIPELLVTGELSYWTITSFARMFGAALLGYGLLLYAIRGFTSQVNPETRRGIVFALILGNIIATITSLTQQFAIWQGAAGWITTFMFFTLAMIYSIIFLNRRSITN